MSSRIIFSLIAGFFGAAIPTVPLFVLSSFVDDKPNLWIWLWFGIPLSIIVFFSPASREAPNPGNEKSK